jgi:hypothetical protein
MLPGTSFARDPSRCDHRCVLVAVVDPCLLHFSAPTVCCQSWAGSRRRACTVKAGIASASHAPAPISICSYPNRIPSQPHTCLLFFQDS